MRLPLVQSIASCVAYFAGVAAILFAMGVIHV
jgi:hypothetical protein